MKKRVKNAYRIIGMMSGTSLDGMDLACCLFEWKRKWVFQIESAVTIPYPAAWRKSLMTAHLLSAPDLLVLDSHYGHYIGLSCNAFIRRGKIKDVDAIASHGHTIFHQPHRGFTLQIGNGAAIHAITGLPVIFDFRNLDVQLGGEGAPLVPVGDQLLFSDYDVCLNIGGIANLSMQKGRKRVAFDIAFANMALNFLAEKKGLEFDEDGRLAEMGTVNDHILKKLDSAYKSFHVRRPSLGREIFESAFMPLLHDESFSVEDRLRTVCDSIAKEVDRALPRNSNKLKMLVTGGGALNPTVIAGLQKRLGRKASVIVPEAKLIQFKEALIFAFLGMLRFRGDVNALKSVTRARRDSCTGSLIGF